MGDRCVPRLAEHRPSCARMCGGVHSRLSRSRAFSCKRATAGLTVIKGFFRGVWLPPRLLNRYQGQIMRFILLCASLALLPALAEARPSTSSMTCAQAAGLVQSRGSALLQTGQRRYDLYLASRAMCSGRSNAISQFAPTLDNPKCHIGYLCERRSLSRD